MFVARVQALSLALLVSGPAFAKLSALHASGDEANAPQAMGQINVSADEDESRSTVGNSTVVGSEQLEAEQAQNFEDAIRYVPGVSIVDLGRFGDNGFNIRGLEGDRVALTIDNLPLAESVEKIGRASCRERVSV